MRITYQLISRNWIFYNVLWLDTTEVVCQIALAAKGLIFVWQLLSIPVFPMWLSNQFEDLESGLRWKANQVFNSVVLLIFDLIDVVTIFWFWNLFDLVSVKIDTKKKKNFEFRKTKTKSSLSWFLASRFHNWPVIMLCLLACGMILECQIRAWS